MSLYLCVVLGLPTYAGVADQKPEAKFVRGERTHTEGHHRGLLHVLPAETGLFWPRTWQNSSTAALTASIGKLGFTGGARARIYLILLLIHRGTLRLT